MKTKRIAIIGAGPTGLTASYQLKKNSKHEVVVFEAESKVGGLAKSFRLWDQVVDIGPHRFFSNDSEINDFFTSVPGIQFNQIERKTSIFFKGTYIDYPLDMFNIVSTLPFSFSSKVLLDFSVNKLTHKRSDDPSFETEMVHRFGPYLFSQFFKDYTERLWGEKTYNLSSQIVQQRIGKFNLANSLKQIIQKRKIAKHDSFYYPEQGAGQVWDHLAEEFTKIEGKLKTSERIDGIKINSEGLIRVTSDSGSEDFDWLISTTPFDQLKRMTGIVPESNSHDQLRFRNTIFIYVLVEGKNPFSDQWIYINEPGLEVGRISNFSNWKMKSNGNGAHVLCLELWCGHEDRLWNMDDEDLFQIAKDTLKHLPNACSFSQAKVIKIPNTYPIYFKGFENCRKQDLSQFFERKIIPLGRGGSYSYINQDICIKMGLKAAESIISDDLSSLEAFLNEFDNSYIEDNKKDFSDLPPA